MLSLESVCYISSLFFCYFFFFFNDTATTEIYTLSLHDALPISVFAVVQAAGPAPVAAAGHSLGEYSAYITAGGLTAPDAARLVRKRGELMHQAGTERPGTMAAVLGLATAQVEAACREASRDGSGPTPANLNAPDQTVISGDPAAVRRAGEACKARGAKRVIPLKVSGAFHSPLT